MNFFSLLSFVGGLALFLFGMHYMGVGLEKASGSKLQSLLEKMTDSPLKGVLLGITVTAVIQSSSAVTVMVVGFVNSGIMKLRQAIGIIMGANIGTTVTAWILSLSGIKGDAWFIKMLNPTSLAPVAALVGIIFIMFIPKGKKKDIGSILVGFAVLMYGMNAMSSAVKPLAELPEFTNILLLFKNPLLGVAAGAILTAIIQSSSASVGILQAISSTGALTYSSAIPIIMGQNIGTCVTALLSSIGAEKNARRAAVVHLYFNVIGTTLFLAVYYLIETFIGFSLSDSMVSERGIAIIHTVFNLSTTALLLPFSKWLEKLACATVRDKDGNGEAKEQGELPVIDERIFATPSIALGQCLNFVGVMADISCRSIRNSISLLEKYDRGVAESIREDESAVDMYEDRLGTFLVRLSSKELTTEESNTATRLLHNIGDLERISDHAVNIMEVAQEIHDKGISFGGEVESELKVLSSAVEEILSRSLKVVKDEDSEEALHIEPLEQVIDNLRDTVKARQIGRLKDGKATMEMGFILSDLLTNFERVSDHCSNLAVTLIKSADESFETHKYLSELRGSMNRQYSNDFDEFCKKYSI